MWEILISMNDKLGKKLGSYTLVLSKKWTLRSQRSCDKLEELNNMQRDIITYPKKKNIACKLHVRKEKDFQFCLGSFASYERLFLLFLFMFYLSIVLNPIFLYIYFLFFLFLLSINLSACYSFKRK